MATTFNKIATIEVGSGGTSSIDFINIPQTYTDLQIVFSGRASNTGVASDFRMNLNGYSGLLNWKTLYGTGSGVSSSTFSGYSFANVGAISASGSTANTFNNATIYLPNYSGSTTKTATVDSVSENNGTEGQQQVTAVTWSETAAITQVTIHPYGGGASFAQYSSASLYGILKGSGGATVA